MLGVWSAGAAALVWNFGVNMAIVVDNLFIVSFIILPALRCYYKQNIFLAEYAWSRGLAHDFLRQEAGNSAWMQTVFWPAKCLEFLLNMSPAITVPLSRMSA